jgi:hypothetical protein
MLSFVPQLAVVTSVVIEHVLAVNTEILREKNIVTKVAEANGASSRTVLNFFADRHVAAPLLDTLKAFT